MIREKTPNFWVPSLAKPAEILELTENSEPRLRRAPSGAVALLSIAILAATATFGSVALSASSEALAAVQVDPDGPAGQQYALPLDAARAQSAGEPDLGVPGAKALAPLSGQGLGTVGRRGSKEASLEDRLAGQPFVAEGAEVEELYPGDGLTGTLEIALLIGTVVSIGLALGMFARTMLIGPGPK